MVVDTDVIIRFLTNDDPPKARRFEKFLERKEKLLITDVTFAEIYWTLKSFYKFKKAKILNSLEALINTASIACNLKVLQGVISLLREKNISFIDAYNASYATVENDSKIMSYDKGFDKISGIKRVEP